MQINELAKRTGVTVRTLHYYDQIGLLIPSSISPAGYRMYDDQALEMLQQILFFKELDFPLEQIKAMMANPRYEKTEALTKQKSLLLKQRDRLDKLIALVEQTLEGEINLDFQAFDRTEIDAAKQKYAAEAKERWGNTDAFQESEKRTATYDSAQWKNIQDEQADIFSAFAAIRTMPPDSERAAQLVERWQAHITRYFYPCTNEILAGLGLMYQEDERFSQNIDRHGTGTAAYMTAAIASYCV